MNALTRLIIAIYGVAVALSLLSPGITGGAVSMSDALIGASLIAGPILLVAWIIGGFRHSSY